MLDKELLDIILCPKCKSKLTPSGDNDGFECAECKLFYPVKEGIPALLDEEAVPLEERSKG